MKLLALLGGALAVMEFGENDLREFDTPISQPKNNTRHVVHHHVISHNDTAGQCHDEYQGTEQFNKGQSRIISKRAIKLAEAESSINDPQTVASRKAMYSFKQELQGLDLKVAELKLAAGMYFKEGQLLNARIDALKDHVTHVLETFPNEEINAMSKRIVVAQMQKGEQQLIGRNARPKAVTVYETATTTNGGFFARFTETVTSTPTKKPTFVVQTIVQTITSTIVPKEAGLQYYV